MENQENLYGSIKLNCETIFMHHISQDKNKLEIYKKAVQEGKITNFDQTTITRLRRLYFGYLSGLIYMYYEPTYFNNIGNKAELLTHALEDKDYVLVHGNVDSTRDIPFFMYGVEHLDRNSWFEVKEGPKTWIYDLFSMLKIEKSVYYELEKPEIIRTITKKEIMSHPGREQNDFRVYHNGLDFMLVKALPEMEKNMEKHPFKDILSPEITRFKKEINFEDMLLEYKIDKKKFY